MQFIKSLDYIITYIIIQHFRGTNYLEYLIAAGYGTLSLIPVCIIHLEYLINASVM